jgi:hypothetical protein
MPRGRPLGSKNKVKRDTSIISTIKADGRKNRIMTEEQKKAMQEGRKRARIEKMGIELSSTDKIEDVDFNKKPVMVYTGKEQDYLDFSGSLRSALASCKQSKRFDDISLEMVKVGFYNPIKMIEVLNNYVELKKEI